MISKTEAEKLTAASLENRENVAEKDLEDLILSSAAKGQHTATILVANSLSELYQRIVVEAGYSVAVVEAPDLGTSDVTTLSISWD